MSASATQGGHNSLQVSSRSLCITANSLSEEIEGQEKVRELRKEERGKEMYRMELICPCSPVVKSLGRHVQ